MNEGIDTGDIGLAAHIQITDQTTAEEVRQRLAKIGARLMARTMDDLEYHRFKRIRQDVIGESLAKKIEKSETRVDWNRSARKVLRHIHGISPSAWCEMPIGGRAVRVMILRCELAQGSGAPGDVLDDHLTIACGEGAIRILELQRAGKGAMKADVFLRGTPLQPPLRLS
jgi:methionyl-tRNA formyltransferase